MKVVLQTDMRCLDHAVMTRGKNKVNTLGRLLPLDTSYNVGLSLSRQEERRAHWRVDGGKDVARAPVRSAV